MMTSPFKAGGALSKTDTTIYIERRTDHDAMLHLLAMDYLLVIEPRQQGKTSLLGQLKSRLMSTQSIVAYVDVEDLSYASEEMWYSGLWEDLTWQIKPILGDKVDTAPLDSQEWRLRLRSLACLVEDRSAKLIILLDEVGSLKRASWAEGFFVTLRKLYNLRAFSSFCNSITFVLSGAFHPRDLIKDDKISPFNVAQRVRLEDFTVTQVQELVSKGPWMPEQVITLANRIYYWFDGQPYLTQLLCSYLRPDATPYDVDVCVERLRREDGNHLPPILERLHKDAKLRQYVDEVMAGQRIKFLPGEQRRQAQLELLGVLKADEEGYCRIRNRMYELALFPHVNPTSTFPVPVKESDVTMDIPRELSEQLGKGNVVLFCGAGISVSDGGIPSDGQLVRELADRAGLGDVGSMTLPDVAQGYELEMGHQSLIAFIAERIESAGHAPLRTHQLIATLPFKRIITTNWDTLLEEALRQAGKPVARIVRDEDVAYVDEEKITLVKLHGSIDQKDTIVVTGDDYYDVFARLPETANLVRSFFATKTLLFLGYGLADEDFKRMYHEVERHLGKHKRRAYAVQLSSTTLAVKYWMQKNVEVIAADATTFLEALVGELGVTSPPPAPASTGVTPIPQSSTNPSTSASTVAPIGWLTGRSGGMNLERGLEAMKARLKGSAQDVFLTFLTLERRLLENIEDERAYGSSETIRSDRARIILELNRLAILGGGSRTFNEMCDTGVEEHNY